MTVAELIAKLQKLPQDVDVMTVYERDAQYGDDYHVADEIYEKTLVKWDGQTKTVYIID